MRAHIRSGAWALCVWLAATGAVALESGDRVAESAGRIEAVQQRAWSKRGSFAVSPSLSYGVNDPFLHRGGAALRVTAWPRSLVGFSLEVGGFTQTRSEAARVAQRELRARMRPTVGGWHLMGGAEASALDGKLALFGQIVPFEGYVRLSAGTAFAGEGVVDNPALALGAAAGFRWFLTSGLGIETALAWRTASFVREVNGRPESARDAVLALELSVPWRFGGSR